MQDAAAQDVPDARTLEVAVDIGGTFTDFVFFDRSDGSVFVRKVPSTPRDSAAAVLAGVADQQLGSYGRFVHATTVVLNAILQRRGARTALVTTAGFRGHIEIGDTMRYTGGLFDHRWVRQPPFPVPHERRFVVRERMTSQGTALLTPDEAELDGLVARLRDSGATAVAVCFLNSYTNPAHEQQVRDHLLRELPDLRVVASSDVREFREYPRFITAVFNAYASTLTSAYVGRLDRELEGAGYTRGVSYMGSAGGVQGGAATMRAPLNLLWGGVVGGVTAGAHLAQLTGVHDIVTLDIGGTSSDVALIKGSVPTIVGDRVVEAFPLAVRQVDVASVGAGGGSIGWVGTDGALKVGPESAGAEPGPACYGAGGTGCTLTDANLVLGRLGPGSLLAGRMPLDRALAEQAAERLAREAGLDGPIEAARGVVEVATTHLDGAIRQVSVERGEDPSRLGLVAFGGAGPMHGCEVAQRLGIETVFVPRDAGNFSAWGLLVSDARHDYVRSFISSLGAADLQHARALLGEMEAEGRAELTAAGFAPDDMAFVGSLEMRYSGQAFVEEVVLDDLDQVLHRDEVGSRFRAAYDVRYGYSRELEMAEVANLRLVAIGRTEKPRMGGEHAPARDDETGCEPRTTRSVLFDGAWAECPVYDRDTLAPGMTIAAPAIVEEYDSTTVIPPGWTATVDTYRNLRLEHR